MSRFKKQFQEAFELIHSSHYIVIVTHINPDADTLSCALALSSYLYRTNIKHKVYNSSSKLPKNLEFLPRFDKIVDVMPLKYDLVIYVDCGDKNRIGTDIDKNSKIINIDHHYSNDNYGDINIVDSDVGSTAEVLYGFFYHNSIKITKEIATSLYVGIYDDSIAFTTPRTDKKTFQIVSSLLSSGIDLATISKNYSMQESLAKYRLLPKVLDSLELHCEGKIATIYQKKEWLSQTGAGFNECDDAVNDILKISIVQVALYLREDKGCIRVSLRGKGDDSINLSDIAAKFNGGGHKNAAGVTLYDMRLQKSIKVLVDLIKNYIEY